MKAIPLLMLGAIGLSACGSNPATDSEPATEPANPGEQAYLQHCAGCHETGMLGAPVVGDQDEWDERSRLWQAVITAHARNGYLDMPAKGGRPDLPDKTIDAAVEYMLEITYPEKSD